MMHCMRLFDKVIEYYATQFRKSTFSLHTIY